MKCRELGLYVPGVKCPRWAVSLARRLDDRDTDGLFNSLFTGGKDEVQRGWVTGSRSSSEGAAEPNSDPKRPCLRPSRRPSR